MSAELKVVLYIVGAYVLFTFLGQATFLPLRVQQLFQSLALDTGKALTAILGPLPTELKERAMLPTDLKK